MKAIEHHLPPASVPEWDKRGVADAIILFDWQSGVADVVPGSLLQSLRDALFEVGATEASNTKDPVTPRNEKRKMRKISSNQKSAACRVYFSERENWTIFNVGQPSDFLSPRKVLTNRCEVQ